MQTRDFDGDGRPDIAVISASSQGLRIYSRLDFVTSSVTVTTVAGGTLAATSMARPQDVNGDGNLDLVVGHAGGVAVFLANGDATFRAGGSAGSTSPTQAAAVGHLNGDSMPDVVSVESAAGRLMIGFGRGDTTGPIWRRGHCGAHESATT